MEIAKYCPIKIIKFSGRHERNELKLSVVKNVQKISFTSGDIFAKNSAIINERPLGSSLSNEVIFYVSSWNHSCFNFYVWRLR